MRLNTDLIKEFQALHLEVFGEYITPEIAELELSSLAGLIRIVGPHKNMENENEEK